MGLVYFFIINISLLFLVFLGPKNFSIHKDKGANKDNSFICVLIIIVFFHSVLLWIYFYSDMQLWVYGNTINAFADSISYLNRNNEELILMNIHDIIESSIGGHSPVIKNEQLHTDTFTLDEVNQAFDLLKTGNAGRIMINIGEE